MKPPWLVSLVLLLSLEAHAGAWGEGSFENDDALDWATECSDSKDTAPVARALNAVLKSEYIEAPEASAAIAAAEVVAAAIGKPSANIPSELRGWIHRQPPQKLVQLAPLAKKALVRIQDPAVSELTQLWSEGKPNKWPVVMKAGMTRCSRLKTF